MYGSVELPSVLMCPTVIAFVLASEIPEVSLEGGNHVLVLGERRNSVTRPTKGKDWKLDAKAGFTGVILFGICIWISPKVAQMETDKF